MLLAGFSMGGLQAIALGLTRRVDVHGVLAVAAWLPHVREFTALVEGGGADTLPRVYGVAGDRDPSYRGAKELVEILTRHGAKARLDGRAGLGHEYPDDMALTLERALEFLCA